MPRTPPTTRPANRQSDIEIIAACLAGRPGSWEHFCEVFEADILQTAQRTLARMGSAARGIEAGDILSLVFEALLANDRLLLRSIKEPFHLGPWLATITTRLCLRERHRRREAGLQETATLTASRDAGPARMALEKETAEQVRAAVAALPLREREVLRLYYVENRPYRDIAAICGLSEDSIGQIKHRARQALADELLRRGLSPEATRQEG